MRPNDTNKRTPPEKWTHGYRDDGLFGDNVTDPVKVAIHELTELCNKDIPEWLLHRHSKNLTKHDVRRLKALANADPATLPDADVENYARILRHVLDGRDFCKWLCQSEQDIYDEYMAPFPDARERLADAQFEIYDIPADAIVLSGAYPREGVLFAWKASGMNCLPRQVED